MNVVNIILFEYIKLSIGGQTRIPGKSVVSSRVTVPLKVTLLLEDEGSEQELIKNNFSFLFKFEYFILITYPDLFFIKIFISF